MELRFANAVEQSEIWNEALAFISGNGNYTSTESTAVAAVAEFIAFKKGLTLRVKS